MSSAISRQLLPRAEDIRRKCLATMPLVAIIGVAIGGTIAYRGDGDIGAAMLWFATAMCVSSYVSALCEGATVTLLKIDADGINGDIVAFLWDLILGGIAGSVLSTVASFDLMQSIGAASAILFVQQLLVDKLLVGNIVGETFLALIHGSGGGTVPDYSLADSKAARGDYEGARALYEAAIDQKPDDVAPYRALAHMLRLNAADYGGADAVIVRALRHARMDKMVRTSLMREHTELLLHYLGTPGQAARVLAEYIDQYQMENDVSWAREQLKEAKQLALAAGDRIRPD